MRQRASQEFDEDGAIVIRATVALITIVVVVIIAVVYFGAPDHSGHSGQSARSKRTGSPHVIMRADSGDGTDFSRSSSNSVNQGSEQSSTWSFSLSGNSALNAVGGQPERSSSFQAQNRSRGQKPDEGSSSLAAYIKGKKAAEHAGYIPQPPESTRQVPDAFVRNIPNWKEVLAKVADKDGVVVFATGTANYVDIMNSFFLSAIVPHRVHNFLFVAMGNDMCATPTNQGILHPAAHCVQYPRHVAGGGDWLNPNFAEVVQIKTDVLLGIIQEGYTALLSDADIHYLRNPLAPLAATAVKYHADAVIQDDMEGGLNSGFMYFRPSALSNSFLGEVVSMERRDKTLRQQAAVNAALKRFSGTEFRVLALPAKQWPCGIEYYQRQARRMYAWHQPCPDCVIVHNNYMLGDAGKEYRAKEFLQWSVDTAGGADTTEGYYSSATTNYIVLGNPDPTVSAMAEEDALRAAFKLGRLLNRVVILPWLRCRPHCREVNCQPARSRGDLDICPLNTRYYVRLWNQELGRLSWREQMFRYNPLTHPDVRLRHNLIEWAFWAQGDPRVAGGWRDESLPESGLAAMEGGLGAGRVVHYIATRANPEPPRWGNRFGDEAPAEAIQVHHFRRTGVVTPAEAREAWGDVTERVLHLHSLYGVEVTWDTITGKEWEFERRWSRALRAADLRQV